MKIKIIVGFIFALLSSSLFAQDLRTCYSAQLLSSKKKIDLNEKFPKGSRVMYIGGVYTVRNGCYDTIKEIKRDFKKLTKGFRGAKIVSTYRFRFETPQDTPKLELKQNKQQQVQEDESSQQCFKLTQPYPWEANTAHVTSSVNENSVEAVALPNVFTQENEHQTEEKTVDSDDIFYFYINPYAAIYQGQKKPSQPQLKGDVEKIAFGMQWLHIFNQNWRFYTDMRIIPYRNHRNGKTKKSVAFDVKEFYLISDALFHNQANFLIGRKILKDRRSWYYHAPLDIVGIFNKHDLLLYELYAGTRLNSNIIIEGTSTSSKYDLKDVKFLIAHLSYEYFIANTIELFGIYENTATIEERDLKWLGVRFMGQLPPSMFPVRYWVDVAKVSGNINRAIYADDFSGTAFDIGGEYQFANDTIALSYAYGSGGDTLYTQPHLTNNRSDYLEKHLYFRYYGSFFDPELSNIKIASLYYAHRFNNNHSAIIALHNYTQDVASKTQYIASSFTYRPNGQSKKLGNEIDAIYGIYYKKDYDWRFVLSYFLGGSAYDTVASKKDGFYGQVNFRYFW